MSRIGRATPLLFSLPALLFVGGLFLLPIFSLVAASFTRPVAGGGTVLSAQLYADLLADDYTRMMIWRTFKVSLLTTVATLVLAFPVALFLRQVSSFWRSAISLILLSPLLTSVVVRTLGWIILLGPRGVINGALAAIGLEPVQLIYNELGIIIGLTHVFFGYMVLSLMTSVQKIDENLLLAASNLGASRWVVLWKLVVPLSLPGILAGSVLVFTMAAGTYATPVLLGGSTAKVMAAEIYNLAIVYMEWKEAAALASLLFVGMCLVVVLATRWAEAGRRKVIFE